MSFSDCPQCRKKFETKLSPVMPFCSVRCQQLDLRLWLNEEQRVPVMPQDAEEAEEWLQKAEQAEREEAG